VSRLITTCIEGGRKLVRRCTGQPRKAQKCGTVPSNPCAACPDAEVPDVYMVRLNGIGTSCSYSCEGSGWGTSDGSVLPGPHLVTRTTNPGSGICTWDATYTGVVDVASDLASFAANLYISLSFVLYPVWPSVWTQINIFARLTLPDGFVGPFRLPGILRQTYPMSPAGSMTWLRPYDVSCFDTATNTDSFIACGHLQSPDACPAWTHGGNIAAIVEPYL
jgi:hypothetical protein